MSPVSLSLVALAQELAFQDNVQVIAVLPRLAQTVRSVSLVVALVLSLPARASASDAIQQLTIRANLEAATALRVSSYVLVFDVPDDEGTAAATVDYVASARTQRAGEVILSVQTSGSVEGPGGSAEPDSTLTMGDILVHPDAPVVAERWIRGGTRSERLVFNAAATTLRRKHLPDLRPLLDFHQGADITVQLCAIERDLDLRCADNRHPLRQGIRQEFHRVHAGADRVEPECAHACLLRPRAVVEQQDGAVNRRVGGRPVRGLPAPPANSPGPPSGTATAVPLGRQATGRSE